MLSRQPRMECSLRSSSERQSRYDGRLLHTTASLYPIASAFTSEFHDLAKFFGGPRVGDRSRFQIVRSVFDESPVSGDPSRCAAWRLHFLGPWVPAGRRPSGKRARTRFLACVRNHSRLHCHIGLERRKLISAISERTPTEGCLRLSVSLSGTSLRIQNTITVSGMELS